MIGGQAIPPGDPATLAAVGIGQAEGGEAGGIGGLGSLMLRVFIENKLALVGSVIIIFFLLFVYVGPVFYHTNQTNVILQIVPNSPTGTSALMPPSGAHWLGTDYASFDELGRLMIGGRGTLAISLAAAAAATVFGVIYGAVSGFVGGFVDALLMRIVDVLLSIPGLFLLVVLARILNPNLWLLIFIIAFGAWLVPARLIRGETLTLRTREYVSAVKAMGGSNRRIVMRHIIPNAVGTIVVNATFQIADSMLLIAALGYLGYGLPAPSTTWGQMLSEGVTYVEADPPKWWVFYPAGICIILTVLAFNFVGDALRDSFETRLQKR